MNLRRRFLRVLPGTSVALLAFAGAFGARAGTNGFVVPSFRASPNTQAGYWELFTTAIGAPGNLPDRPGATTTATLTQHQTNAFVTGSGNLYNLDGTSEFTVSNTTPFTLGTVVLQTRTLGTELQYASPTLQYTDGSGSHTLAPIARYELDRGNQPGLGATVSSLWQWNLSGLGVTQYSLSFRAAGPSTSFDSMTLDTAMQFVPVFPQPFALTSTRPDMERWMYANNGAPCDRPAGAVFGTFGDEAGVDTRHAQHLVGWDTSVLVPTNRGPARYLLRRCRVSLTINRGNLFPYDPTQDDFRTYFETNQPAYFVDSDPGRPIELFGAAFRNGFTLASFDQCAPFGSNATGQRNAYAAGWSTNGVLVDVGNNVGKTNTAYPPFEVAPFAIGQTTNVAPGQLVPAGATLTFDLNLEDPFVLAYVQSALDAGRLRLMLTGLHGSGGQFGAPTYPDFATRFNEVVVDPTRLELEGLAVRDLDSDADGLPDDWERFYFASLAHAAGGDVDADGATNAEELRAGTNPNSTASVLRLLSVTRDPAGRVGLRFTHAASRHYSVEFSQSFGGWTPLANGPVFVLGSNVVEWTDESPGGLNRFYRVRAD